MNKSNGLRRDTETKGEEGRSDGSIKQMMKHLLMQNVEDANFCCNEASMQLEAKLSHLKVMMHMITSITSSIEYTNAAKLSTIMARGINMADNADKAIEGMKWTEHNLCIKNLYNNCNVSGIRKKLIYLLSCYVGVANLIDAN